MIARSFLSALAVASLASAQTYTSCNPTKKDGCPTNPALGNHQLNCDFTKGACAGLTAVDGSNVTYDAEKGALFRITQPSQAPTVVTDGYIFFGRVEVVAQATPGQGVVTAIVFLSADLDEIDWEWVGGDTTHVQSNCFGKGKGDFQCQGVYTLSEPMTSFHTYTVDWTAERIEWIIDGNVVKTLEYSDAGSGNSFPQTPSQIKIGTWVAGQEGKPQGTIDWAGGLADFSKAPFDAYYKSLKVIDYAGGSSATSDNVTTYEYSDRTGSWQSIKIDKDGSSGGTPPASTTAAPAPGSPTSTSNPDAGSPTTDANAEKPTSGSGWGWWGSHGGDDGNDDNDDDDNGNNYGHGHGWGHGWRNQLKHWQDNSYHHRLGFGLNLHMG